MNLLSLVVGLLIASPALAQSFDCANISVEDLNQRMKSLSLRQNLEDANACRSQAIQLNEQADIARAQVRALDEEAEKYKSAGNDIEFLKISTQAMLRQSEVLLLSGASASASSKATLIKLYISKE